MEVSSSVALLRLVSLGDDLAPGPLLTSVVIDISYMLLILSLIHYDYL